MCLPAVPALIAATALSAGASLYGGFQQAGQARYAASIQDRNAQIASGQAQDAIDNTRIEAMRRYRQLAQTKGSQEAALAANGVDLGFGTSLDLQRDVAMIGAEDAGQIYKGGMERAKSFDTESWNARAEAASLRAKAKGAIVNGVFGAASTALGGASQINQMKAKLAGNFG